MSQPKQRRETIHERNLARRVRRERERRGWTYEALAKAVTDSGCLMHPSTPFKIEKGEPPRRITIDEFVAFSKVFDLSLDELLVSPDIAEDQEVSELVGRCEDVWSEAREPLQRFSENFRQLSDRTGGVETATEALLARTSDSISRDSTLIELLGYLLLAQHADRARQEDLRPINRSKTEPFALRLPYPMKASRGQRPEAP